MHRIVPLLSTVLLASADLPGCELVVDQQSQNFDRFIASSGFADGLHGFHLHTNNCMDTANNKRLVVSHNPSRKGSCTTHYTPCGLLDHRNIEYFDRHTLDCGTSSSAMTEFKLERCDADNMRFRYVCCEYYEERVASLTRTTDCNEVQGKRLEYLDRHPVACLESGVMTHFQMLSWEQTCEDVGNARGSSNPGGYRRFKYTCVHAPIGGVKCNRMLQDFSMERMQGLGGSVLNTQGISGFSFNGVQCQDTTSSRSITLSAIAIAPHVCRAESTTTCSSGMELADIGQHNVDCGSHYHLTSFEFTSDGCAAGSMRIKFTCCSPDMPLAAYPPALPSQFSSCFHVQDDIAGVTKRYGNTWGVQCGTDQVLLRWQMVGGCFDSHRRIEYVCRPLVFGPM